MQDVFEVAKVLVSHAVENYGQKVDLIAYYGSRPRGDAREDSDLDIFYTPADGKNPPIGRTFLLCGRLFDFWAIKWETLEGFASGRIRGWAFAPALVHYANTLYVRSPEAASRLQRLKKQILALQKPEARPQMIKRSLKAFTEVLVHLGNLRLATSDADLANVKHAAWKVVQSIWECLALANQVFFDRGLGSAVEEVQKLEHRPQGIVQLISTICSSSEPDQVLTACERLTLSTRQILRGLQKSIPAKTTVQERFQQVYPEMRDKAVKLLAACERGDHVAAGAEAWNLQDDVTMMLSQTRQGADHSDFNLYSEFASAYRELALPDLMEFSSGPLDELAGQTTLFDERLRWWLREQSVDLCEYRTLEELRESL
jgi:predicted nucleotidyltransferase